jgi:transposase InsO family protein
MLSFPLIMMKRETFAVVTGALAGNGVAISMDGKGAWRDNVFVERLWRSVKYEEVYLRAYDSVSEARASIGRYFDFYNGRHKAIRENSQMEALASIGNHYDLESKIGWCS